jgi:hypothetical protein
MKRRPRIYYTESQKAPPSPFSYSLTNIHIIIRTIDRENACLFIKKRPDPMGLSINC